MAVATREQPVSFRISQAGACPRRLQLEAWGVEGAPVPESTERAYAEGNIHEPSILAWAKDNVPGAPYVIYDQQRTVYIGGTGFSLTGHVDGLLKRPGDFRPALIVEAKCLARRAFQELRKQGVKESHPQYYTQVQLYLHALRHEVTSAVLVARNKETPRYRLWEHHWERIDYDPVFAFQALADLEELAGAIAGGRDVAPPFHPDKDWQCRYPWCVYSRVCWPDWHKPRAEAISKDELAGAAERYRELSEQISELEQERDELKQQLLASCDGAPVQAGRYIVRAVERRTERFDTKAARRELPADVLARLVTVSTYKILQVEEA